MPLSRLAATIPLLGIALVAHAAPRIDALDIRYLPVGAMLTWECDDAGVADFAVERSDDGFAFQTLARIRVDGRGETGYHYLDTERPDARHYYRVVAYGRDGTATLSALVEAARPGTASWSLSGGFGVDVGERFDFEVEASDVATLACDLYDFLGAPVRRLELLVTPGPNRLSIETADLNPGAYRLELSGDAFAESVAFVKVSHAREAVEPLARGI